MLKTFKPGYLILGLIALVIGIVAQFLLTSHQPVLAAVLYAIAVILFVFALRSTSGPEVQLAAPRPIEAGERSKRGYWIFAAAIVLALTAFALFETTVPAFIPWLLHLSSIVLLIVAVVVLDQGKKEEDLKTPWSIVEIGIFVLIILIAAFMRLYRFDQVPFGTWYDEADEGINALRIMNERGFLPIFAESTLLPAHYIYLIVLSFKIFGISTASIRAVSVVFGIGTVFAAYLTGKELFNRRMGLVLAFLIAVARWDLNWSRIGMHGVSVPFFEFLALGMLLRAFRRQRLMDYALSGASIGFGLCFYPPLRFFPFVLGLFFVVLWINRHELLRFTWRGLIVMSLSLMIAAIPVLDLIIFESDAFWSRMEYISIFTGKTTEEGWRAAAKTSREHLLMFNLAGDRNGRHNLPGEPMLDSLSGALMVLGVGLSLWRIRQPGSFLALAWLLLMLIPGIFALDFESPQSLRAIGSLPAAYIMATIPIYSLSQEWEKLSLPRRELLFTGLLLVLLGVLGWLNFNTYFNEQAKSGDSWASFSTPETIVGKIMAERGNSVEYYVSTFYYQTPTVIFLAPEVTKYHRLETYNTLPVFSDGTKGIMFFFDPERKLFLEQAKRYYPSAAVTEFNTPSGSLLLYEVYLSPQDIQASFGLTASYYDNADWSGKPFLVRKEKNLDFDWKEGDPGPFPLSVEWTGVMLAPAYGNYKINARSPMPVELFIDEVPFSLKGDGRDPIEVSLAEGDHNIRIRTQAMPGHFELDWQPPDESEVPIPEYVFLLPPLTNNGLLGRYYADPNWSGVPAFTKIDPWIYYYFHTILLPKPYTIEWSGNIQIPTSGDYKFGLESIDESALWIDDQQVIDDQTPNEYNEAEITLSAGFHSIRVRFADRTGYTHVNLFWTPPGAEREVVPQQYLFPPQGDPSLLIPVPTTPTP